MIVSHKHKFIYIRTRKTASTSIELALRHFCGDDDIITPTQLIESVDNYTGKPHGNYKLPNYTFNLHESGRQIKKYLGKEIYDSYYKFTFERNSYIKAISGYVFYYNHLVPQHRMGFDKKYKKYFDKKPNPQTIEEHRFLFDFYLKKEKAFNFSDQQLYTDYCDNFIVDDIFQFDGDIQKCFDIMSDKLNLPRDKFIEYREKTKFSKNINFSYDWLINDEVIKEYIENEWFREINHFNYKWEKK